MPCPQGRTQASYWRDPLLVDCCADSIAYDCIRIASEKPQNCIIFASEHKITQVRSIPPTGDRKISFYPTYAVFTAMAFLPYPVIDLYIRAFVNGSQPYSEHRYFIDLRPNTPGHLWLGFALSPKGTVAGADSRLQRAVSVAENTFRFFQRSIKGSVSGRYPVIPLLGISVRKVVAFPSLLPLCRETPRRVYMRQRVAALSKGASLAPQEIKMLFAVLPAANL